MPNLVDSSYNLIGTRTKAGQSQAEYFNTGSQQGFSDAASLSNFANQFYGLNSNSSNVFDLLKAPKAPANTAIPATSLNPQTPLNVTPPVPADKTSGAVAGATQTSKSLADYIKELTPPKTAEQTKADTLSSDIMTLLGETKGKTSALSEAEASLGVPELSKQLAGLNTEILAKTEEYNVAKANYEKLLTDAEGKVQTIGSIRGEQAQIARSQAAELNLKASEIGLTQARALGLQGQVQQAQAAAAKAVDLKYAPVEEELQIKQGQLEALIPILNKQEKITAEALNRKYQDEQSKLAEEKDKSKRNLSLAFEQGVNSKYALNGSEVFDVQTGDGYSSEEDFKQKTGMSVQEAIARGMVTTINYARIAEKGAVQNLINNYPDALVQITDSLEVAQQKVLNSRSYQTEQANSRRIASGARSGSGSGSGDDKDIDPQVEAFATQLINGSLKPNQLSGTAEFKGKVLARYEELKTQVSSKYENEFEARVDYDQELRALEAAKANNELAGSPSELIAALVNVYGKYVSEQEIKATVYNFFGVNKTTPETKPKESNLPKKGTSTRLVAPGVVVNY